MTGRLQYIILALFLIGWVTYAFALFNVGRFSITLLLLASFALALLGVRSKKLLSLPVICLLTSGLLAWAVAILSYSDMEKTFTHLFQYFLAIGVMIGAQTINWKDIFPQFRKTFAWIAVTLLIFGLYRFFARKFGLPFAFLPITNLQLSPELSGGLQRGAKELDLAINSTPRVSSFFPEPSDLGRFMLWVFALGYASIRHRWRIFLMLVSICGIVLSQSLGAFVGLVFFLTATTLYERRLRKALIVFFVGAIVASGMYFFQMPAFKAVAERSTKMLKNPEVHLSRGRFQNLGESLLTWQERPLVGHGLASIKKVVPDFVIANTFTFLLIERGLLGTALFFLPFGLAYGKLMKFRTTKSEIHRVAWMVLIVETYCFFTFAMLYFQLSYLALGFALYASENPPETQNKVYKA